MNLVDDLEALLKNGQVSIGVAASILNRTPKKILACVKNHPDKFDVIGIVGHVSTFCISLSDKDRPIQLVLDAAGRE